MPPGASITSSSPIRRAWLRWKSLRLPWRKRFLVGQDLHGNTFWEFRDTLSSSRMRRIVQYQHFTHASDVSVTPQWHQWLRHVRADAPSLDEQARDVVRASQLKILARQADERWEGKASALDLPGVRVPAMETWPGAEEETARGTREAGDVLAEEKGEGETRRGDVGRAEGEGGREKEREDPWKQARRNPGEEWQPQAWGGRPKVEKRR